MRIVTWNVNSLTQRLPRVEEWLEQNDADIVCLQETKQTEDSFPTDELKSLGYESAHYGEGRWNGVAILSRVGLADPASGFGTAEEDHGARLVSATCAGIRVHSVYVPNGRSLDSEHYGIKLAWLARLHAYLSEHCDPNGPVVVCGDFNVAPRDVDLWDPAAFVGATHVSEPERSALAAIESWGLEDAFAASHPDGGVFSWWDYRAGDFHEGRGMRIDLILATQSLSSKAVEARVDRNARKGKKPSDHAPVVVDFDYNPGT